MRTLYEIADEMKHILDYAQEEEIDEQVLLETLESMGLDEDLADKVESYWHVIEELEASNKRIKEEEDRLKARRTTQANNIKRLKNTLTDMLDYMGVQKLKTDTSTIWVQNNPEKLEITDERSIPKEFWVPQEPKLNRKELLNRLKQTGEDLPGVSITQTRGVRRR